MSARLQVGGFLAVLALLFGAAYGIGKLFDDGKAGKGYSLQLSTTALKAGSAVPVSFTVLDADHQPVTRFDVRHAKRLHLVAVSKDFARFRHVHPTMSEDGTWTTKVALGAGEWRLYADFQPEGGSNEVVDSDVTVAGRPVVTTDVEPHRVTGVDGYQVVATGDLVAGGQGSMLEFQVTRNGSPVTDLEPYLGAYGHLVVLRETDMRYLHVHPEEGPAGPGVSFHVEVPTAGTYYLYLDFKHDGAVHTAAVVLGAAAGATHVRDTEGMDHGDH